MKKISSFDALGTTEQMRTDFYYGADEQRNKMVHTNSLVPSESYTKYYCGNYEKTKYPNGSYKEVTYIGSQNGVIAAIVKFVDASGTADEKTYSLLKDNLGSIMEIRELLNNGTTRSIGKFSYDVWGRLRNPNNYSKYELTTVDITAFEILSRGFTGHEHLLEWGIINMNGRIYDPNIGQFMQPDNYISSPDDPFSYNRYTYCMNNPLKYIDPSGEVVQFAPASESGSSGSWDFGMVSFDNYITTFSYIEAELDSPIRPGRKIRRFVHSMNWSAWSSASSSGFVNARGTSTAPNNPSSAGGASASSNTDGMLSNNSVGQDPNVLKTYYVRNNGPDIIIKNYDLNVSNDFAFNIFDDIISIIHEAKPFWQFNELCADYQTTTFIIKPFLEVLSDYNKNRPIDKQSKDVFAFFNSPSMTITLSSELFYNPQYLIEKGIYFERESKDGEWTFLTRYYVLYLEFIVAHEYGHQMDYLFDPERYFTIGYDREEFAWNLMTWFFNLTNPYGCKLINYYK